MGLRPSVPSLRCRPHIYGDRSDGPSRLSRLSQSLRLRDLRPRPRPLHGLRPRRGPRRGSARPGGAPRRRAAPGPARTATSPRPSWPPGYATSMVGCASNLSPRLVLGFACWCGDCAAGYMSGEGASREGKSRELPLLCAPSSFWQGGVLWAQTCGCVHGPLGAYSLAWLVQTIFFLIFFIFAVGRCKTFFVLFCFVFQSEQAGLVDVCRTRALQGHVRARQSAM